MDKIKIFLKHNYQTIEIDKGTPIMELAKTYAKDFSVPIYAAIANKKIHDLNYKLNKETQVSFVGADTSDGARLYERTLSFIFIVAAQEIFPTAKIRIEHSASGGMFAVVDIIETPSEMEVASIKFKMQELINDNLEIERRVVPTKEAVEIFSEQGLTDKADLLRYRESEHSSVYKLAGHLNYFYGIMLPETGFIKDFSLLPYKNGIIILGTPNNEKIEFKEQEKIFEVFQEFEKWGALIGIRNVAQLNKKVAHGNIKDIILMTEALHEKKLSGLADIIANSKPQKKLLLIAGPSSAGKTTFANRLAIDLKVNGIEPITISMDNFYVNRVDTPKFDNGDYDFECVEAIDVELFNHTMLALVNGEETVLPKYNFKTGERIWDNKKLKLGSNQLLIVEGIHGLNPELSEYIPDDKKFRIYINALTHLNYDEHNRIPTTEYRMIRRMVRDFQFRNTSAAQTIKAWDYVKEGEEKYIYPYQENADYIFNTSLVYEMAILKTIAMPLLREITQVEPEYIEANRIIHFLDYFVDGSSKYVPYNSILGEFIGKSCFL